MSNKRILVISDLHAPYMHQDAFKFLKAVKKSFNPTRVINIGDEVDNHAISFHPTDPDLLSPGDELKLAQKCCKKLHNIFPVMDLVDSNHGSLAYRRGRADGIPRWMLKDYNEILKVDDGWQWHNEIIIKISSKISIIFRHQFGANILKSTEQMGMCCCQGHYHSKFEISYTSSPLSLTWGMTVGCLIDTKSMAFEYNKIQLKRPILGVGVIDQGVPKLIPMYIDSEGRWVNKIYGQ